MSIGGHHRPRSRPLTWSCGGTDEWLTPPELIHALGPFDLDPCAPPPERRPWPTAARHYASHQDGLQLPWTGRVWLNPPYGKALDVWMERMAAHGRGTALIFARTETQAFQRWIWPICSALLFLDGRLNFYRVTKSRNGEGGEPVAAQHPKNAGAPSVLVAYGDQDAEILRQAPQGGPLSDSGAFPSLLRGAYLDCRKGLIMVPEAGWTCWRRRVLGYLRRLGRATLRQVYEAAERDATVPLSNHHVQAKIRQMLYRYAQRDGTHWRAA